MDSFIAAELPKKFVMYLPLGAGMAESLCAALEILLGQRFGGVTNYPARGSFRMADDSIVAEEVRVLEVFCETAQWETEQRFLLALAEEVASQLNQQAIACAIDGRMRLISPGGAPCETFPQTKSAEEGAKWLARNVEPAN